MTWFPDGPSRSLVSHSPTRSSPVLKSTRVWGHSSLPPECASGELRGTPSLLGGDVTRGTNNSSWSLAVQAQADCSSYPRGMPCTTQGAMPKQKNQKPPVPSPQSDRGPRGPQAEDPHAPGEAGATRNVVKRQARGAPRQSTAHSERGRGTRHARAAPPGQPAGARNRGRGPLHGTGEPGGEATSGGPFSTTRSDTQHKNGWPGGTEGQSRGAIPRDANEARRAQKSATNSAATETSRARGRAVRVSHTFYRR